MNGHEINKLMQEIQLLLETGPIKNWACSILLSTYYFSIAKELDGEAVKNTFRAGARTNIFYKNYNNFLGVNLLNYNRNMYDIRIYVTILTCNSRSHKVLYSKLQYAIHEFFDDISHCIQ